MARWHGAGRIADRPRKPLLERAARSVWGPIGLTLAALTIFIIGATLLYQRLEGWDFLTSLIFTLATITTVGYGNVFPSHRPAEILTAVLMAVTLTSVVVVLSTFATRLITMMSRGMSPMERNERAIQGLQDHIVVAASGELAVMLVQNLRARDLPFVAITSDDAAHARWLEEGVPSVLGNPDDEDILHRAGVERARGLIVALDSDADNVFVTLSAHDLNPHLRIIGRAHSASSIMKLRRSGANEVVLPEQVAAINLVDLFRDPAHVSMGVRQAVGELREALHDSATTSASQRSHATQVLFRALRLALQELGPDMDTTLYTLGQQFGADAVAPNLSGDQLCDVLEALSPKWAAAGLGYFQVVSCADHSARITETECATCEGMPSVGKPVCHLERGVLAGALEARLGRTVHARETKCWGMGDRICEFEVTVDADTHRTQE
jgi:voltage-gated potassium channel